MTKSVTESEAHSRGNDVGLQKRVEGNRGIAMFRKGEIVGNFLSNAFKEKFLVVFRKHAAEKSRVLIRPAQDIHFLKNQTNKKQNHNLTHSYIQQLLQISKSLESVKHLAEPHQN